MSLPRINNHFKDYLDSSILINTENLRKDFSDAKREKLNSALQNTATQAQETPKNKSSCHLDLLKPTPPRPPQ